MSDWRNDEAKLREREEARKHRRRVGDALRRLHDDDPALFRRLVGRFLETGDPETLGRPPRCGAVKVTEDALAHLLAHYESAQAEGRGAASRWIEKTAAPGAGFKFTEYDGSIGWWRGEETLRRQVKAAQRLARTDAAFREHVAFLRWALAEIA